MTKTVRYRRPLRSTAGVLAAASCCPDIVPSRKKLVMLCRLMPKIVDLGPSGSARAFPAMPSFRPW